MSPGETNVFTYSDQLILQAGVAAVAEGTPPPPPKSVPPLERACWVWNYKHLNYKQTSLRINAQSLHPPPPLAPCPLGLLNITTQKVDFLGTNLCYRGGE